MTPTEPDDQHKTENPSSEEEIVHVADDNSLEVKPRRVPLTQEERKDYVSLIMVLLVIAVLLFIYGHSYMHNKALPEGHMALMSTIIGSVVGYLYGERKR